MFHTFKDISLPLALHSLMLKGKHYNIQKQILLLSCFKISDLFVELLLHFKLQNLFVSEHFISFNITKHICIKQTSRENLSQWFEILILFSNLSLEKLSLEKSEFHFFQKVYKWKLNPISRISIHNNLK